MNYRIAQIRKRTILTRFPRLSLLFCLFLIPLPGMAEESLWYPVQSSVLSLNLDSPGFRAGDSHSEGKTDKSLIAVRILLPLVGGAIGAAYGGTHFEGSQPGMGVFMGFMGGMLLGLCFEVYTF